MEDPCSTDNEYSVFGKKGYFSINLRPCGPVPTDASPRTHEMKAEVVVNPADRTVPHRIMTPPLPVKRCMITIHALGELPCSRWGILYSMSFARLLDFLLPAGFSRISVALSLDLLATWLLSLVLGSPAIEGAQLYDLRWDVPDDVPAFLTIPLISL